MATRGIFYLKYLPLFFICYNLFNKSIHYVKKKSFFNHFKLSVLIFLSFLFVFFIPSITKAADTRTKSDYQKIFPDNTANCDFFVNIYNDPGTGPINPIFDKNKSNLNNPPIVQITKADGSFGSDPKPSTPPGWEPIIWRFKLVEAMEARGYLKVDDNYYYFQCDTGNCERMAIQINSHNMARADSIYALWRNSPALSWADASEDNSGHRIESNFCLKNLDTSDGSNFGKFMKWAQQDNIEGGPIDQSRVPNVSQSAGPVQKAINAAIRHVFDIVGGIVDAIGRYIMKNLLIVDLRAEDTTRTAINDGWKAVRDVSNSLLILGLLIIALANALRFQIDYYTYRALIPRLAIAAIFINFSYLFTMAIIDLANILTSSLIQDIHFLNLIIPSTIVAAASGSVAYGIILLVSSLTGGSIAIGGIGVFILFVVAIAMITMITILIIRMAILYLLVVFSPLVFLFSILPFTRGLPSTWWNYLVRYAFMGPIVAIILLVASKL